MWSVIYERKLIDDIGECNVYGIRNLSFCIGDISASAEEIERLVRIFNEFDVSPVNAADIIEDYINGGLPDNLGSADFESA